MRRARKASLTSDPHAVAGGSNYIRRSGWTLQRGAHMASLTYERKTTRMREAAERSRGGTQSRAHSREGA